jgi:sigma-54 dependent transcriptional regulator, acetoin dehydrogenase operon transcriptional activator AcoR
MASPPAAPVPRGRRLVERNRPIASALTLPESHVTLIEASHERCRAFGLSRIERPDFAPLGRSDLTLTRERNLRLHSHAAPVMEMLYEQIVNTSSMVVLTDATGIVIHSIGDDDFLERAAKVALSPGANWSEPSKGTNAVGTALVAEAPTLVHADEHYLHANHFLTCSAAPILDPRGNILGVLDVSGDHRSYHQHTMALVKMSARMIENQWLSDHFRHAMRLHFHARVGFIGTLMEGILAISQDGRIVGANRSALELLAMSSAALRLQSLVSMFGTSVGALVDHFRSPLATPLAVHTPDGRSLHLHARFNWPVWSQVTEAAAAAQSPRLDEHSATLPGDRWPRAKDRSAAAPPAAPVAASRGEVPSLAQLQTGDAQMDALVGKLERVIDRDIPILLLGETGTGKELLARAIHAESARARQAFVAVNCASVPDTLIEAELFGHEEGAFTGARRQASVGKIVQACGGTLFLDDIGDLPLALQARLLRLLQERQVAALGSTRAVPVDVAIICATQFDLRDRIDARLFRQDLYYRLNGMAVRVPSLRERTDLATLVRRILDGAIAAPHLGLSAEAQNLMQGYHWPGNVRQLFNVLRTAAAMAGSERWIRVEHLPEDFVEELRQRRGTASMANSTRQTPEAPQEPAGHCVDAAPLAAVLGHAPVRQPIPDPAAPRPLHEVEREAIERAVAEAGGNISVAAKRLGISRNTIYRRLRWHERASD